ncbi:Ni/Fe-hydrogenase subunit HybB-like protein [Gelidibacter algens]|uniref:Ni/Fe-hydrogenase subunit HybB-like protein n=1 Tax=Gelidibacter algens TaxID=49280 RepID=A0A1A7QQF2_9FLAO|nr:quinol:cytochrome C oxidoreductase [Gelidibacter algens]OBX21726.1 quinol:cytochrome C oxidoreductase [Gelidibacter algens]RAJ23050.1 Ni/Fe-hydrogenase subunit HybB-like protein [Gelidibacter algens]
MYTISNRLKTFSIILIVLGILGVAYGFMTSHKSLEEVKTMLAEDHSVHGADFVPLTQEHVVRGVENDDDNFHRSGAYDATADVDDMDLETEGMIMDSTAMESSEVHSDNESSGTDVQEHSQTEDAHGMVGEHGEGNQDTHAVHVQEQLAKRPWSALYVAAFFFMMIALGALAFYAINIAAQAGWSPLLMRVMEGITAYLLPGAIIVVVIALGSHYIGHHNEIFIWMNPEVVADDELIQNKSSYLNIPWFVIRAAIFIGGWCTYRYFARKFSIAQDNAEAGDIRNFKKSFRIAAGFLVFFIYTESIMSWDWIMSVDPHWFSTLFGWYVLASMLVSGITVIAMVTIYLKSKGLLPMVNDSHIHDLAKFMFGFSIFWAYLWFSQFMLIWYANIPEEVVYFITRIEDYNLLFFGMLVLNFVFPFLILMNSEYKRIPWFVVMSGVLILVGHYIDVFVMIMPATVGDQWFIGIPEIGSVLLFGGLFMLVVFTSLTKAPLTPKGNPFIKESEHFHY